VAPTTAETTVPADDAGAPAPPANDAAPPAIVSKGCAIAPASTGAIAKKTTTAAGKARAYHLAVPAGAKTKQPLPLVFVLHGAGDTAPENMRDWFAVESKLQGALAVYPQALERTRSDGSGGKVTRWDLSGNDDLAFFDAMLTEVADGYCVDRAHVFVTGFSSGGNFSQHLACNRQKDVKGMAVVSGPGPFSSSCGGAVPVWMTHDANDDTLPVKDARSSRDFWATENGCQKATWTPVPNRPECKTNTSCPSGEPLVYCETTGVGHDVPKFAVESIGGFFTSLVK
jgi:polyhydroxybutyrate depolymerase